MPPPSIVIDTNVIVAGLRSRRGYSFKLLELVGTGRFEISVSVALMLEYEDVLGRSSNQLQVAPQVIDGILDYFASVAQTPPLFFLWRPALNDPKDDMLLELAVNGGCEYIITFNTRHFKGSERIGIQTLEPKEFLARIGEAP